MVGVGQDSSWGSGGVCGVIPRSQVSLKAWGVQLKMKTQIIEPGRKPHSWKASSERGQSGKDLSRRDSRRCYGEGRHAKPDSRWLGLSLQGFRWYHEHMVPSVQHAVWHWAGRVQPCFHPFVSFHPQVAYSQYECQAVVARWVIGIEERETLKTPGNPKRRKKHIYVREKMPF